MHKVFGVLLFTAIFTLFVLYLSRNALPDSNLYSFRRIYEKTLTITKNTPEQKVEYYQYLLNERFNELKFVFIIVDTRYVISSSLRYSATAGHLTDLIIKYKMQKKADELSKVLEKHKIELNDLNVNSTKYEKKFLEDDVNYLNIYLDKLAEIK